MNANNLITRGIVEIQSATGLLSRGFIYSIIIVETPVHRRGGSAGTFNKLPKKEFKRVEITVYCNGDKTQKAFIIDADKKITVNNVFVLDDVERGISISLRGLDNA